MPRARTIAATLALVLALVGGGLAARDATRPAAPQPSAYRVAYDTSTVDAALWFVARYPGYFTSGEGEGFEAWLAGLTPQDREFVEAMGVTLAWAWVAHELEHFEGHTPVELAVEASELVRYKTLNQLEHPLEAHSKAEGVNYLAWAGDPSFGTAVFARLIRGASNCEGQNHLVAMLLDAALDPGASWIPQIDAELVGVPGGHNVTRMHGFGLAQPIIVDAWANLPPFTVNPGRHRAAPLLQELGDIPTPLIPRMASRTPRPAEAYAGELVVDNIEVSPGPRAPTKRVSLEIRAPKLDRPALERIRDPWRIFLLARVLHLYDDPRAAQTYAYLLDYRCDDDRTSRGYVCTASARFHRRLTGQGDNPRYTL